MSPLRARLRCVERPADYPEHLEADVLLRDGRVLADGTRAELLRNEPLSAVFGGAITVVEQEGRLTAYAG